jgi:hypothetical protein
VTVNIGFCSRRGSRRRRTRPKTHTATTPFSATRHSGVFYRSTMEIVGFGSRGYGGGRTWIPKCARMRIWAHRTSEQSGRGLSLHRHPFQRFSIGIISISSLPCFFLFFLVSLLLPLLSPRPVYTPPHVNFPVFVQHTTRKKDCNQSCSHERANILYLFP